MRHRKPAARSARGRVCENTPVLLYRARSSALVFVLFFLILALTSCSTTSTDPKDTFRNKTVRILVAFSAGGGYDLYARVMAEHLGRHLPGSPTVVVENMPGA